jgi:hypothetical protein
MSNEKDVIAVRRDAVLKKLAETPPVNLPARDEYANPDNKSFNKAAVIPFYKDESGDFHFYWMKPESREESNLPAPKWQLCKGTRMFNRGEEWVDFKPPRSAPAEGDWLETLPQTALREGAEEIGLRMDNISQILLWGDDHILAQTDGRLISLWVTLVEVKDKDAFDAPDTIEAKTTAREWIKSGERTEEITDSHLAVVNRILPTLQNYLAKIPPNQSGGHSI